MTALMPEPFTGDLKDWSPDRTGKFNTPTYNSQTKSSFVPADQDFGGCLQIYNNFSYQYLRYKQVTPFAPEKYYKVTARVKVESGRLPRIRIGAFPMDDGFDEVQSASEYGPSVNIQEYGVVYEISTIIGPSPRADVGIVWDSSKVTKAHIGIDIIGASGTVTLVDDIEISNVSNDLVDQKLARLDVRDYGAVGDNATNNAQAFRLASAAAAGRTLYVPKGTFYINGQLNIDAPIVFEGKLRMDPYEPLILTQGFNLTSYIDAFGGDEQLGFEKALQALLSSTGFETLDMQGRRIDLRKPVDVASLFRYNVNLSERRVLKNGYLSVLPSNDWASQTYLRSGYFDANKAPSDQQYEISNVSSASSVPVASLVTHSAFGREVYVTDVNSGSRLVKINRGAFGVSSTANLSSIQFKRFQYALDFSGISKLNFFEIQDIQIDCNNRASGILLPKKARALKLRGVHINEPKDRGITSFDRGCQGIQMESCQFVSAESSSSPSNRRSIAFNINKNDAKISNCWAQQFKHFAIIGGQNNIITGCHFFQGHNSSARTAGLVLTDLNPASTIAQNYVDNCFIEWSGEHLIGGDFKGQNYSFSGLSITGNIFLCSKVSEHFRFIKISPRGRNHKLSDLTVSDNTFRNFPDGGVSNITRVEEIDTSYNNANFERGKTITMKFTNNVFNSVKSEAHSPLTLHHVNSSKQSVWTLRPNEKLKMPFDLQVRRITAVIPDGPVINLSGRAVHSIPYPRINSDGDLDGDIQLVWPEAVSGSVYITLAPDKHYN